MPSKKQSSTQLVSVIVSRFPNMQKCKVFQTAFLRTLQITYRLDCDDEGCDSDREGLKRVVSRPLIAANIRKHCTSVVDPTRT